jgi:hypothetical protein
MGDRQIIRRAHLNLLVCLGWFTFFSLGTRLMFLSKLNLSFSLKLGGLIDKLLFVTGFEISFPQSGCLALLIKFTACPIGFSFEINLL